MDHTWRLGPRLAALAVAALLAAAAGACDGGDRGADLGAPCGAGLVWDPVSNTCVPGTGRDAGGGDSAPAPADTAATDTAADAAAATDTTPTADVARADTGATAPLGVPEGAYLFFADISTPLGFELPQQLFADIQVDQTSGAFYAVLTDADPVGDAPRNTTDPSQLALDLGLEGFVFVVHGTIARQEGALAFASEAFRLTLRIGPITFELRDAVLSGVITRDDAGGRARWDGTLAVAELFVNPGDDPQTYPAQQDDVQLVQLRPDEVPADLPRTCAAAPCAALMGQQCDVPAEGWPPAAVCESTCEGFADCRYTEGQVCVGAACLPDAALAAARCGDARCDENERYAADACPTDCPAPPAPPRPAGGPCDEPGDCETNFCLDQAFLTIAMASEDVDVPHGYCSSNPLADPCFADEDCGDGGFCADASGLAGTPLKLCLHACADDGDCRYAEGYRCFAPTGAAGEPHGCLPGSLLAAIRCGDGLCDPAEAANPAQCEAPDYEEDCP